MAGRGSYGIESSGEDSVTESAGGRTCFSFGNFPSKTSRVRIPSPAPQIQRENVRRLAYFEDKYDQKVLDVLLLSKVIEFYTNSLYAENKSPETVFIYNHNLQLFIKRVGDLKLVDVDQFHVREYLAERLKGRSSHTGHQAFRVLRSFFNWSIREGFIATSPLHNIQAPKLESKVVQTYTREEVQRMIAECPQKKFLGSRNQAMISCLIDTGMRESELVGLTVDNVDFRGGAMKIRGKGNKERIVHINEKARQALWKYMLLRDLKATRAQTILFLSEEMRPITRRGLLSIIVKIGKDAGVKANVHKFRHSCAIEFLRSGGDLATLRQMLGHTTINTTMRYLSALNSDDVIIAHRKYSPGDKFL